jgi:hypothetical protein
MERLSRSGSVRENGSRKSASVGANVFDRLAKGGAAAGPRRGSGALETLNSPRAVSAARSPLTNDDSSSNDNRRNDVVKRGTLTKIKDLVFQLLLFGSQFKTKYEKQSLKISTISLSRKI